MCRRGRLSDITSLAYRLPLTAYRLPPANGPWMIRTDYVGNSNDSYWLTNPRALLLGPAPFGFSLLYGRTGVEQTLRTRMGFRQLDEMIAQRKKLQLVDLQELMFANRVNAAELILPQLLPFRHRYSADAGLQRACCMGSSRQPRQLRRGAVPRILE